ncbi:Uncharacterized protein family Cys-rich [Cynara cardunculus var. scolymus]|uniref:Uncharacterized protein family Cys-rich n=1 Tax=Cynara cardunculus var. scolymus TaxID=59895 RepID=A0A103XR68_CYNCS|nr:Uncharacterized protein family Cys-rich [Cynara cardunculus var. scolymus]
MSSGEEQVNKMKHRQGYRNVWHTDLMSTMAADTPCNLVFCCFGNSVASTRFMLQDEFHIQTTKCDNCIIGCMVCLQQLACIFSIIACLVGSDELSDASQLLNCLADLVFCTVCTCMQTQHKVEMDKRDGKFGMRPMDVPPVQEMSRIDQPYHPNVQYGQPHYGYPLPQHQAQGYPPPMYYPPQGQGYPPQGQGYPPHGQGYPPQGQAYPPGVYPPPPQGQGYPPATYPPPPQGQGYPPAGYPSQPPPPPPPQGQGNQPPSNYGPTNNQTPGQEK